MSGFQAVPDAIGTLVNVAGAASDVSIDLHVLKLGVNYRLGETRRCSIPTSASARCARLCPASWELEAGARYVYGWGRFQKDLGIPGLGQSSLASRLTYEDMTTNGGRAVARVDAPWNVMVKGVLGTGSGGGHMNDEDWGLPFALFVPYSNTISDVDNKIRYGTVDVGYDWWRGEGFRAAPFIGYSYFKQEMDVLGCRQIANPNSDCVPADPGLRAGADGDRYVARAAARHGRRFRAGAAADAQRRGRLPAVREL